jgi:hypothetical protein
MVSVIVYFVPLHPKNGGKKCEKTNVSSENESVIMFTSFGISVKYYQ